MSWDARQRLDGLPTCQERERRLLRVVTDLAGLCDPRPLTRLWPSRSE